MKKERNMFDEELDPKTKKPKAKDLGEMSVEELESYKENLKLEIVRVDGEIVKKGDYFGEAEAFFK